MRFVICVLTIVTVSSDSLLFETEMDFLGREAFLGNTLESLSNISKSEECATHCLKHQNCSAFGFNTNNNICQLLGDLMFREAASSAPLLKGQRYYSIRKAWCPLEDGFHIFRGTGLCLRWTESKTAWKEAAVICNNVGGRLAVLNSETKREAVLSAVLNMGSVSKNYHLGASRDNAGTWTWSDGTLMSLGWFDDGEPTISSIQTCLVSKNGKAHNANCETHLARSVCEIIEN